jgi:hypothetical protein
VQKNFCNFLKVDGNFFVVDPEQIFPAEATMTTLVAAVTWVCISFAKQGLMGV